MNKEKMVKVRLLSNGGFAQLKNISFPMDVEAKISERGKGIEVHQSSFGIVFYTYTSDNEWVFFTNKEYELITEEEPAQQQQTIEQLLFTRNEYKEDIKKTEKMIIDLDTEILNRIGPLGYGLVVNK
jgi:hypothetical protein